MKNIKHLLMIPVFSLMAFSSCSEAEKIEPDCSKIELSQNEVMAGPEGGKFNITVTSSEDWRVSGFCEWVSVEVEAGKNGEDLKIQVQPNTTKESRKTEFHVFAGSATALLTITSIPEVSMEFENGKDVLVGAEAGKFTVAVLTNAPELKIDFEKDAAEWLETTQVVDGFPGKLIYEFAHKRTEVFKERVGVVNFGVAGSDKNILLNVCQAQLDTVYVVEGSSFVNGLEEKELNLNIMSNVEFTYKLPDWIQEVSKTEGSVDENTGLRKISLKLHLSESQGSRGETIKFVNSKNSRTVGFIFVKQQNPNPIYVDIPDDGLRRCLSDAGWILVEPGAVKGEILASGLSGKELSINTFVGTFEGLEKFPALVTLILDSENFRMVDLTVCKNLNTVKVSRTSALMEVKLPDSARDFIFYKPDQDYMNTESFKLSGSGVETIDLSASNYMLTWFDKCTEIDLTGCPKMKTLNVMREYYGTSTLETVYVTQEQKDAIDAQTISITKSEQTKFVVKK